MNRAANSRPEAAAMPVACARRSAAPPATARALRAALATALLAAACARAGEPARPDYQLVNTTQYGRVFAGQRSDAPSLQAALQLTLHDAARYFGAAPKVRTAYQDSRTPGVGGATFVVTAWGIPAKGLIACRVERGVAHVAIAFIRADAPAREWARLTQAPTGAAPPAAAGSAQATGSAQAAAASLRPYRLPDGTCSVGLAPGWHTRSTSCVNGVVIEGPDGATVNLGTGFAVNLPGSSLARMGGAMVAPFASPAETLRILAPQLSQRSVQGGGPALQFDSLQAGEVRKSSAPNGRAQILTWGVTERRRDGSRRHFKTQALFEMLPTTNTSFLVMLTQVRAPDALYDRELSVMLAMTRSLQTNDAAIARRNGEIIAGKKAWFDQEQREHREQMSLYDQQNRGWERQQNAQARRNDDFDEVLRGYRTVEDSRTGERASVSLGDVDRFVDDLNARDPGRYSQIPLRDELDPTR